MHGLISSFRARSICCGKKQIRVVFDVHFNRISGAFNFSTRSLSGHLSTEYTRRKKKTGRNIEGQRKYRRKKKTRILWNIAGAGEPKKNEFEWNLLKDKKQKRFAFAQAFQNNLLGFPFVCSIQSLAPQCRTFQYFVLCCCCCCSFLCDGWFCAPAEWRDQKQRERKKEAENLIYFKQKCSLASQKIAPTLTNSLIHVKQIFSLDIGNRVRCVFFSFVTSISNFMFHVLHETQNGLLSCVFLYFHSCSCLAPTNKQIRYRDAEKLISFLAVINLDYNLNSVRDFSFNQTLYSFG